MKANSKKILKRILLTILLTIFGIPTLLCLVSGVAETVRIARYKRKYPFGESIHTEFYEVSDTIIQTPVSIDDIPLQNLPVRDLSFGEIMQRFGSSAVCYKKAVCKAYQLPDFLELLRFPRETAEKCSALGNKQVYEIELQYDDGSNDSLELFVYESLNEIQILWGYRANYF